MKIQKITLISLLTFILLLSVISARYLPLVFLIIPVTISLMTGLIIFTDNGFGILIKSALSYLFIGLNDIGIKLFAGGIHDSEGTGWIHLLLFIGLIPCFIILLIGVVRDNHATKWIKALSIFMFLLLIFIHLQIFETLGMIQSG